MYRFARSIHANAFIYTWLGVPFGLTTPRLGIQLALSVERKLDLLKYGPIHYMHPTFEILEEL